MNCGKFLPKLHRNKSSGSSTVIGKILHQAMAE